VPKEGVAEKSPFDNESSGYVINQHKELDLSQIDVEKIREEYKTSPHKNTEIQDLSQLLERKVRQMVHQNSERRSFAERFQRILDEYNAGSATSQESFDELLQFMNSLTEEEQRAKREGMTERELEIYDMLMEPKLTEAEIQRVKLAAKDLLKKLKEQQYDLFPPLWYRSTQMKKKVECFISDELNAALPDNDRYGKEVFTKKKEKIYTALLMRADTINQMFVG